MPTEPLDDLRALVGGAVIVEDHVDDLTGGDTRLDRVQEADELLVAVVLHAAVDDLAFEHVEGGKERMLRRLALQCARGRLGAWTL